MYRTNFTVSALATDNKSFILCTTSFNLTLISSSQQSEITAAFVFSYKTSTGHLPPFGSTANVERLSLTNLPFSCDFPTPMLEKIIQVTPQAVSYVWTELNRTKFKCLLVHPVVKLQKVQCMYVRATYMKMTRDTNLMQQFIYL